MLVTPLTFVSWNRILGWLRLLDALRRVAQRPPSSVPAAEGRGQGYLSLWFLRIKLHGRILGCRPFVHSIPAAVDGPSKSPTGVAAHSRLDAGKRPPAPTAPWKTGERMPVSHSANRPTLRQPLASGGKAG
jgi:hypothetical protein